jgi:hypothetical protein
MPISTSATTTQATVTLCTGIDIFGGRFSETLGYGTRAGHSIKFTFEYPDGPFHNTFLWNPEPKSWHFLLEQKDAAGKWKTFADQNAVPLKK